MTSPSKRKDNPLLSAALAYAERGWRVFPLKPRDKAPLTLTGFKEASHVRTTILEWWTIWPEANIGLVCGDPFDVLDIDGPASVPALQQLLGPDYKHAGPVANTGKGKHLYFAALPEGKNRAGLLGGKLDYRGTGGYVVGPPSVHPSGRVYHWDDGRGPSRELPQVPTELVEVILKPPAQPARPLLAMKKDMRDGTVFDLNPYAATAMARPPIVELIESMGATVVQHGAYKATNCLFHNDPGPSMILYESDNSFHCFGCEAHGDSLNLARGEDMTGRKFSTW